MKLGRATLVDSVTRILLAPVLVTLMLAAAAGRAGAVPITYTEVTTGTGTIGGTSFSNRQVTISFAGDTDTVVGVPSSSYLNSVGTLSVKVANLFTATFTEPGLLVSTLPTAGLLGVGRLGTSLLITAAPALVGYDLTTALGPVSGPAVFVSGAAFTTTAGDFVLQSAGTVTVTVTTAAAVPEPAGSALLGTGLLGLALLRRRAAS